MNRVRASVLHCGSLVLVLASPVLAQSQPERFAALDLRVSSLELRLAQEPRRDAGAQMTTSGFFLGVVGMLGGAAVGSGVGNARCGEDCVGRTASAGAAIAGSIMVPVGVHIAAQRPRGLLKSMAASTGTGALVWLGVNAIPGRPVALAPFIAAPLQIWTSMKIETRGQ